MTQSVDTLVRPRDGIFPAMETLLHSMKPPKSSRNLGKRQTSLPQAGSAGFLLVDTRGLEPRFFHVAFWRDPSTLHRFHARKAAMGIYLHTAVFTSVLLTLLILPVRSYPGTH